MLTFFEYLRQRAFESVLAGAHEAIEFLERQETLKEPPKLLAGSGNQSGEDRTPKPPRKREDKASQTETKRAESADEQPFPAPRKHRAPANQSKAGK
ncbi:MAG: hypothetical protein KDA51_16260 [Planctomycetales bacterium]|nr:hypothetical protein [Planctomycetales bacterium]